MDRRLVIVMLVVSTAIAQACGASGGPASATPFASPSPSVPCVGAEYLALPTDGRPVTGDGLDTMRTIIENRLRDYGLASPSVQTLGADRIVVQFPAAPNVQDVRQLIGARGQLDFVEVPANRAGDVVPGEPIPADLHVIFSGDQVDTASMGFSQAGQRAADLTFKAEGAQLFDDYAAAHQGGQFAIVVDGVVVSAPVINASRFGGKAQITGAPDDEAAVARLVTMLKYGALPYRTQEVRFGPCPA